METKFKIRFINSEDIPEVLEIYKPFITSTSITPEYLIPDLEDFSAKIKNIASDYPFLVCEANSKIVGYTYANKFRPAQGHQWSAETSIYISPNYQGNKVARPLYEYLFIILKLQNYINVFAGIVLPNKRSEVFHETLGFRDAGIFRAGIYKFEDWHDVKWVQLNLTGHIKNPPLPKPLKEVVGTPEFETLLKKQMKLNPAVQFDNL
jgi:L-amino acid N-acyltransferase YncA